MRTGIYCVLLLVCTLGFAGKVVADDISKLVASDAPSAGNAEQYDAVFSTCQPVVHKQHGDFILGLNHIGQTIVWGSYLASHGWVYESGRGWVSEPGGPMLDASEMNESVTLVEKPKHGELTSDSIYMPEDGYYGRDQMVFVVGGKDPIDKTTKKFKVIHSVEVIRGAPEYAPEECQDAFVNMKQLPNTKSKRK